MRHPIFFHFGLLALAFTSLYTVDKLHEGHLTVERAMAPMQHLSNARDAILNNNYNHSIKEIDEAIMDMKIIEHHADKSAADHIERAIESLKKVEDEIKNDSVVVRDLNRAFFNALNSIAYANVTISEVSLDKGEKYKAMGLMNASFAEMIRSLKYAEDDSAKRMENKVIGDIRTILQKLQDSNYAYRFNYDSLNKEIEELIEVQEQ